MDTPGSDAGRCGLPLPDAPRGDAGQDLEPQLRHW